MLLSTHLKIQGKLRYRVLPMMWSECGSVSHSSEKERKLSLILKPESRKFWGSYLWF